MMSRITAITIAELKIAARNRWVILAVGILGLFAFVLAFAGSAPTGTLGVDRLTITVVSLASLSVYLVPLLGLLLSFDSVSGESDQGTLLLLMTYPVSRLEIIAGKFLAHLGVLTFAIAGGFGGVGLALIALTDAGTAALPDLVRLIWTSILLGAAFLGIGYAISTSVRQSRSAAGLAIAIWLIMVVLYDIGLLGALVIDDGGFFTKSVFPWLLAANPADGFRLYNLSALDGAMVTSGMSGIGDTFPLPLSVAMMLLVIWSGLSIAFAGWRFSRMEP